MDFYSRMRNLLSKHPLTKRLATLARRLLRKAVEPLRGSRDRKRLESRFPDLARYGELAAAYPAELRKMYQKYVSGVSDYVMAVSLQLSIFLMVMCRIRNPRKILDLGSGYSSAVFRSYAARASNRPSVHSIDDSVEWLEKTRDFLSENGLAVDNLMSWEDFVRQGLGAFDFVLYDLGHVRSTRKDRLKQALASVVPGGMIVLDDMNFITYKTYVRQVLRESKFAAYSLEHFTKDSLGRYSYLLIAEA